MTAPVPAPASPEATDPMEHASRLLVEMRYAEAEHACAAELAHARADADWARYSRILLPLQEARRQRRMAAAEARVHFVPMGNIATPPIPGITTGCVCMTTPEFDADSEADAHAFATHHDREGHHVQVLLAQPGAGAAAGAGGHWRVRSFGMDGAAEPFEADVPAPPAAFLEAGHVDGDAASIDAEERPMTAGHWFIAATESLGDAGLATCRARVDPRDDGARVTPADLDHAAAVLGAAGDHELLHQHLAALAGRLAQQAAGTR